MPIARTLIRPLGRGHGQAIAVSSHLISRQNHTTSPNSQPGALHGIKILDLTRVLAVRTLSCIFRLYLTCQGPFCTQILADYGADVLKVENPKGGVSLTSIFTSMHLRNIGRHSTMENKNRELYLEAVRERCIGVFLRSQS